MSDRELQNNNINDWSDALYSDIAEIIIAAKKNVTKAVNNEISMMYWYIGKKIKADIMREERAKYGSLIVDTVSDKLLTTFGRGYSRRNLFNMIKFYECFGDFQIVQSVTAQLPITHLTEIIKIKDKMKREFYMVMCFNESWSVAQLKERISSMLYERTAISKKPEQTIKNDIALLKNENKMSVDLFFRDPYILDFLGLKDTYSEKDLESAILVELERFILEMGADFAFMARQKRITIDNEDYYIDLLFYHRKMCRLVVLELKLDKFKPEHKGQVELYLRYLEKNEKLEGEESPVAIILCAEKSEETIELLELDSSGIHVAEYITELPPKELLRQKLHDAINRARSTLEN